MPKTVIYAPNIHVGGGLVLLKGLIEVWPVDIEFKAHLDIRVKDLLELPHLSKVIWVKNNIFDRFKSDYFLAKAVGVKDTVLIFHGTPPIFKFHAKLISFMQNRILIEDIRHLKYSKRTSLRLIYERFLFRLLRSRVDEFIVQSDTFKSLLSIWCEKNRTFRSANPVINVMPFMKPIDLSILNFRDNLEWDFIYVADGLAHKNHEQLLHAWLELAKLDLYPSLALTLGNDESELLSKIDRLTVKGLKIFNIGQLSHHEIQQSYLRSSALIYPSTIESFGLPLVEANELNIPILASELDYVYEVCRPTETFDPNSSKSISRAVMKFLNVKIDTQKIKTPSEFLSYIIGR